MFEKFNKYFYSMLNESDVSTFETPNKINIEVTKKTGSCVIFGNDNNRKENTKFVYKGKTRRRNHVHIEFELYPDDKELDKYEISTRINHTFWAMDANLNGCEDREDRKDELEIIRNTRIEILKHFRMNHNPQFVVSRPSVSLDKKDNINLRINNNKIAITRAGFVIEDEDNTEEIKARNPDYNKVTTK
jgi:hypothetical protein